MNAAEEIREFLYQTFQIQLETNDEALVSGGLLDSMQALELAMFVQSSFNIEIGDVDMAVENFDSINSICALIAAKT